MIALATWADIGLGKNLKQSKHGTGELTMSDLISRGRARHEFAKFFQDSKSLVDDCDSLLCMLPTIDAVPVVRCKDCDFWRGDLKTGRAEWGNVTAPCEVWSHSEFGYTRYTAPDDFCSYGERKDS